MSRSEVPLGAPRGYGNSMREPPLVFARTGRPSRAPSSDLGGLLGREATEAEVYRLAQAPLEEVDSGRGRLRAALRVRQRLRSERVRRAYALARRRLPPRALQHARRGLGDRLHRRAARHHAVNSTRKSHNGLTRCKKRVRNAFPEEATARMNRKATWCPSSASRQVSSPRGAAELLAYLRDLGAGRREAKSRRLGGDDMPPLAGELHDPGPPGDGVRAPCLGAPPTRSAVRARGRPARGRTTLAATPRTSTSR